MNDLELEFCSYIQQVFLLKGALPGFEACQQAMPSLNRGAYTRLINSKSVRGYLELKGIDLDRVNGEVLTPLQLTLINSLLDWNDQRPDHKKLSDLKISNRTYQAWRRDPAFQTYLKDRVTAIVGDDTDEVDRALFDAARAGDISAIKYLNTFTGRFKETTNEAVDVHLVIVKIMEIILKHVTDPQALENIGRELELLSLGDNRMKHPVGTTVIRELI